MTREAFSEIFLDMMNQGYWKREVPNNRTLREDNSAPLTGEIYGQNLSTDYGYDTVLYLKDFSDLSSPSTWIETDVSTCISTD